MTAWPVEVTFTLAPRFSRRTSGGTVDRWRGAFSMIHFDPNHLIRRLVVGLPQFQSGDRWLASGESLAASALAWAEFLNGPVPAPQVALVEPVIGSRVIPFDGATAAVAAGLFNQTGRRRGSRFDCLIAAAAIRDQADFATENQIQF